MKELLLIIALMLFGSFLVQLVIMVELLQANKHLSIIRSCVDRIRWIENKYWDMTVIERLTKHENDGD